ncbi:hypothetical protein D3C71_1034110 [compost metagenome]
MSSRYKLDTVVNHFECSGTNGFANNAESVRYPKLSQGFRHKVCNCLQNLPPHRLL